MNKRALIGKLAILVIVAIFLIGAFVYFTGIGLNFKNKGLTVGVTYDPDSENTGSNIEIIEVPSASPDKEIEIQEIINETIINQTLENNNSYNLTEISENNGSG